MVTIASIAFLALVVYSLLAFHRSDARARTRKLQSWHVQEQNQLWF